MCCRRSAEAAGGAETAAGLSGVVEGRTLADLRELAAVYDGVFSAAPVPGMGFTVSVAFPRIRYNNGLHSRNAKSTRGE